MCSVPIAGVFIADCPGTPPNRAERPGPTADLIERRTTIACVWLADIYWRDWVSVAAHRGDSGCGPGEDLDHLVLDLIDVPTTDLNCSIVDCRGPDPLVSGVLVQASLNIPLHAVVR